MPEPVARHALREDVAFVRVRDADPAVVSLAWRKDQARPFVAAFVRTARAVAASRDRTNAAYATGTSGPPAAAGGGAAFAGPGPSAGVSGRT